MQHKAIGTILFIIGGFFILMHTLFPFLWNVIGIQAAYPLASDHGIMYYLQGFSPAIGAALLLAGNQAYSPIEEKQKN